mgnify:CR=1 FL=1
MRNHEASNLGHRLIKLIWDYVGKILPDKLYLSLFFRYKMGYWLDWKHPKTFNEKLQWLKLYDRHEEYSRLVDKYAVKEYVADLIGGNYIIPTLGVWDNFDDIDFSQLPNQFVLKCTNDRGGVIICNDKSKLDIKVVREKLNRNLRKNFFYSSREYPYKQVKPRIIAEKYMDAGGGELPDYKLFCFNGKMKFLFVATDRNRKDEDTKFDFFDENYNHLRIRNGHPNANITPSKPKSFELMKMLAERLSQNIPQVRVDFYDVNGKVYFGEMTFFHWGGTVPFEPTDWDYKFGEMIDLPLL